MCVWCARLRAESPLEGKGQAPGQKGCVRVRASLHSLDASCFISCQGSPGDVVVVVAFRSTFCFLFRATLCTRVILIMVSIRLFSSIVAFYFQSASACPWQHAHVTCHLGHRRKQETAKPYAQNHHRKALP